MAKRGMVVALGVLVLTACGSQESDPSGDETPSQTQESSASTDAAAGSAEPSAVAPELTGYGVGLNGTDTLFGHLEAGSPSVETIATLRGFTLMNALIREDGSAWVGSTNAVAVITPDGKSKRIPIKGASSGALVYDAEDAIWAYTFDGLHRIDPEKQQVVGSWPLDGSAQLPPSEPMAAADGSIYLCTKTSEVFGFDGQHATLLPKLPFPKQGWNFTDVDAAAATETALYVADLVSGRIAVYDIAAKQVTEVEVTRPLDTKGKGETGRTVSLVGDEEGGAWIAFGTPASLGTPDPSAAALTHVDVEGSLEKGTSEPVEAIYDETGGLLLVQGVLGIDVLAPATGATSPLPVSLGALLETFRVID